MNQIIVILIQAYGFSIKETTESSCVAKLIKSYQERVDLLEQSNK